MAAQTVDDEVRVRIEGDALRCESDVPPLNLLTAPRVRALREIDAQRGRR